MRITWDKNAHAVYLYLSDNKCVPHLRAQEITDCIKVDWDMSGNVSGIEILGIENPIIEDITSWT